MKPRSLSVVTILGLVIAAIGIVVPIIWDQYKTKVALELRQLSNSVVISHPQELDKLQLIYAGNQVQSLSRIEFELINVGRTPIRQADIVAPIRIKINNARIIDAKIRKMVPANLEATQELSTTQDAIALHFPLLNPGDALYLTLLAATDKAQVSTSARIAGLDSMKYTISPSNNTNYKNRDWTFYALTIMTVFTTLVFFLALYVNGAETAIADMIKRKLLQVPHLSNVSAYKTWLSAFESDKSTELKSVKQWMENLSKDDLTESEGSEVQTQIQKALTDASAARAALISFGIFALIGNAYIIYRLW
jgi:hypothetical protein